ncbi:MAG: hypothetical protein BGO03_11800 [Mesorhizobium sp. 61-13]|nr:MAG: hypothetical protein BGO03_11800 [Mesorhizobium sp. 61-13]
MNASELPKALSFLLWAAGFNSTIRTIARGGLPAEADYALLTKKPRTSGALPVILGDDQNL